MQHSITTAVDHLNEAFLNFKHQHDDKLQEIKAQTKQVGELNEKMEKASDRLDRLEVALKRPGYDATCYLSKSTDSAFTAFLRKGIESNTLNQKSLTSAPDTSGGYLMSQPTLDMVHKQLQDLSIVRQLARITTISSDSLELIVEAKGAAVGWVTEIADRDETEAPELIKVKIPIHQIYAKPRVSQKLLDDSYIDIEEWLARSLSDRMSIIENNAFIEGDGNNKPKGILSYPTCTLGEEKLDAIKSLQAAAADGSVSVDALIDIVHSLKPEYLKGASWLMSRSAAAAIRKLKDEQGSYLWQQSLNAEMPNMLLGYPVFLCDDMPAYEPDKKTPSIVFGNFKEGYQIVDRAQIHILRDPYSAKPYVEFYATKRVGGAVINCQALRIVYTGKE